MESWQLQWSYGIMQVFKRHVYRLWSHPFFEHFQPIDFVFSLASVPSLSRHSTLNPPALLLGFDKMQSGSAVIEPVVVDHFSQWSSGRCLIWIFCMSSQVFLGEMTLPRMMALLTLERTFPFIPWGVKCIMDIFNLSPLHHFSHLSNVLWTEYPVYTSNPCSFFPSCVGV